MGDFEVRNAQDLARLAKALKDAGRNDLRKELLRRVRESGVETIPKIQASALERLPRRGGLAAKVAAERASVRASYGGNAARVKIWRKRGRGLNEGRLRHPVFGHMKTWVGQEVDTGWFDDPIRRAAPKIRLRINRVVTEIRDRLYYSRG